jgi:hypothetical protein
MGMFNLLNDRLKNERPLLMSSYFVNRVVKKKTKGFNWISPEFGQKKSQNNKKIF